MTKRHRTTALRGGGAFILTALLILTGIYYVQSIFAHMFANIWLFGAP